MFHPDNLPNIAAHAAPIDPRKVGTADDSAYVQDRITKYGIACMPRVPVTVTCDQLLIDSSRGGGLVQVGRQAKLKHKDNASGPLISLANSNVVQTQIINLNIDGNRTNQATPRRLIDINNDGGASIARHDIHMNLLQQGSDDGIHTSSQSRGNYLTFNRTYFCDGYGLDNLGSDATLAGNENGQSGLAGYRAGGDNANTTGGKNWLCGRLTPFTQPGLLVYASNQTITGQDNQQNFGPGVTIFHSGVTLKHNIIDVITDFNNQGNAGSYAASIFGAQYNFLRFIIAQSQLRTRVTTVGVTSTAGTGKTVTAADGAFTSADVGRNISGTGIPAGSTIASINSSTSVEISLPETISNTGVTITIGFAGGLAVYDVVGALSIGSSDHNVIDFVGDPANFGHAATPLYVNGTPGANDYIRANGQALFGRGESATTLKTSNYVMLSSEGFGQFSGGGGGVTATLPAAPRNGVPYTVKKMDAGAGAVTVTHAGNIQGGGAGGTRTLAAQWNYETYKTFDGGTTWVIVGAG